MNNGKTDQRLEHLQASRPLCWVPPELEEWMDIVTREWARRYPSAANRTHEHPETSRVWSWFRIHHQLAREPSGPKPPSYFHNMRQRTQDKLQEETILILEGEWDEESRRRARKR